MTRAEWFAYRGLDNIRKAQLRWCHQFVPSTLQVAREFISYGGDLALAACVTDADYLAVTTCFDIAHQLIKESQSC